MTKATYLWMALAMVLAVVPSAQADDDFATAPDQHWTLKVYWENDAPFYKFFDDTDRWYTNGTAIVLAHRPDWAEDLARRLPFADQFGPDMKAAFGYTIGHRMYTPFNISDTALVREDHPYAGYFYGGVFLQRADDVTLEHIQIDLGVLGPTAQGEELQTWVHEITESAEANGWDNQLHDEFTVQFTLRKKWRMLEHEFHLGDFTLQMDVIPQAGLALGTVHRHLEGDFTLRLGHNLPDDFGPGRLADPDTFTGEPVPGLSVYGFVRLGGKAIEHDVFLDGNNYRDSHFVTKRPFVGELQTGVQVSYHWSRWSVDLGWSLTFLTEQFEQARGGTHSFGAWTFGASYWF